MASFGGDQHFVAWFSFPLCLALPDMQSKINVSSTSFIKMWWFGVI